MFHPIGFAFLLVLTLSIQAEIFSQQCPYLKMKMNESSPQEEILIKILNFNILIITIQNIR